MTGPRLTVRRLGQRRRAAPGGAPADGRSAAAPGTADGHVLPSGPVLPWVQGPPGPDMVAGAGSPVDGHGPMRRPDAHVLPSGPVLPGAGGPLLQVDGLSAGYGSYRALFDVSLAVPRGVIVAVLGPNGSGKSTLARALSGLVRVTSGHVVLDGRDITGLPAHQVTRRGLVHVPEGRGVFASLSVEENLLLSFGGRLPRAEVRPALERSYAAFPMLAERRRQLAGTLSGGQQRLLSLAKVLAAPARLLVVDELSLGLAPAVVDTVYDGLVAIRAEGTSLLVVEQQVDRALAIADRAVVLSHGHVAWSGPAAEAWEAVAGELRRQDEKTEEP